MTSAIPSRFVPFTGSAAERPAAASVPVLNPPEVIRADRSDYPVVGSRCFQGIPSVAVSPRGRLWATWYAGPTAGEDKNNYAVLATSRDHGETWQELQVVDPDGPGPLRAYDPEVWVDPAGRLWWFWAQAVAYGEQAQTWAMCSDEPDADTMEWTGPFHVAPGVMMCKPTVLSNGKWLLPVSDWAGRISGDPDASTAAVYASDDRGASFRFLGAARVPLDDRRFDEHMVVERKDESLWMWVRTNYGIGTSESSDGGRTWSVVSPSGIAHANSRFFVRRLRSGNLLLVKHGPLHEQTGRSHLTAYVSRDDGHTWEGGLLLDERVGIAYPDGQETADGTLFITYDYQRTKDRAILFAAFTEADVLAGAAVSGHVRLLMPISNPPPLEAEGDSVTD